MLTGTPLDLTPFGGVLQGIGLLYWLLVFAVLVVALVKPDRWPMKLLSATVALAVLVGPIVFHVMKRYEQQQQAKARLEAAMARFEMRCKSAGEKITRTVDDVDGILVTNIRAEQTASDSSNPNWPDAGLPHEAQGEWYLRTFLLWEHHDDKRNPRGYINEQESELPGYAFVDVPESDGTIFRYKLIKKNRKLSRELVQGKPAHYAVSFVNYIDPEDRQKWIAGTTVSITDTLTKEVIAEKTWYFIEPGQGNTAGFRNPWGFARSCSKNDGWGDSATRFFVDQILKPKKAK